MSDFTSVFPENKLLDPNKRVNYIHGLVLGVDEFQQEEFYLLERDKLHNRALHGYGTACGLSVSQEDEPAGIQIKVEPGIAISPSGQVIQVSRTQCATLDEWLASHSEEVAEVIEGTSGALSIYLMLCYRECKTDLVPIPTGPCQSLEETSAPSRIADDFSLSFELQAPPEEHFESPMQAFSELLTSIPVAAGGSMSLDDIKLLVRSLIPTSPPEEPPVVQSIAPENVDQFFQAAFLVWVTEVKPCLTAGAGEQVPSVPYQHCVFLAQLNFDVQITDDIARVDGDSELEIAEESRQFLINTQGLQDYLGPLSYLIKSPASLPIPTDDALVVLTDADAMSLSGDQVITGSKTFNAPIVLSGDGRVRKSIILPAHNARLSTGVVDADFNRLIPSARFATTGANAFNGLALFNLPIPDDMLFTNNFQFRLVWGFQGSITGSTLKFNWNIDALAFGADDSVDASASQRTDHTVSVSASQQGSLIVTDFRGFTGGFRLKSNSRQAVIQIGIEDPGGAVPAISLMEVELQYVANSLGRRM